MLASYCCMMMVALEKGHEEELGIFDKSSSSFWSYAVRQCVSEKNYEEAISIYRRKRGDGSFVVAALPLVLKASASLGMIVFGKILHSEIVKHGVGSNVMVGTSLVDMYGKCGDLISSRKVFDVMPQRNVVTWNAMIGGYMKQGNTLLAWDLFQRMPKRTSITWNKMINGYAKNRDMAMAKWAFERIPNELKNVVTWTIMVDGYVHNGDMESAREHFDMMPVKNFHVWSVMMTGYFKKRDVVKARDIFDGMDFRNLVNWNALISGYAQNGRCKEALDAFRRMQAEGFEPDEVTSASILSACAQSGMLDAGKEIHEMILQKGIQMNEFVLNGLVDMYGKCGDLGNASLIFNGMTAKSCTTWNSLITGFSIHGKCSEAIELLHRMESSGVKPDSITFLAVLSACAHGGYVEEGLSIFFKMKRYGVTANIKHYGCLVDLLGRAGKLQDAFELISTMPVSPNETVLGALLGACRIHSDTTIPEKLFELVREMNPHLLKDPNYVLLSSIYAAAERWEKAEGMRVTLSAKGTEKLRGFSSLVSDARTLSSSQVLQ